VSFQESISIIIPLFNEEEIIEHSVELVMQDLNRLFDDYELILIDDGSTDGTKDILNSYSKQYPGKIVVFSHETNMGVGVGILTGIELAQKKYLMTNFADIPFETSDLEWIFKKVLEEQADGCVVVRENRSANSPFRKLTSYTNYCIIKTLFGTPFKDFQFVQLYRTDLVDALKIESRDLFIPPEIMIKLNDYGYKLIQCVTTFHKRPGGDSKYGKLKYFIRTLIDHLKFFWRYRIHKKHMKDSIDLPSYSH